MSERLIIDTGPIVAFIDRRDEYHDWAEKQFRVLAPPFATCEAVLVEAFFLLSRVPNGRSELMGFLSSGLLVVPFRVAEHVAAVRHLVSKYERVPMSLTDACLVRMAEVSDSAHVLTLDSDFRIYRKHGRRQIPLIIPDGR